jgi:hypothetical protein
VLCPVSGEVLKELLRVLLFIGDDWAEDHVRHEALEVERGCETFACWAVAAVRRS